MKISWTEPALSDLENLHDYIKKDSEFYAKSFIEKIVNYVEYLSANPELGRQVPEANQTNIREIIFQNYRIIYQILNNNIQILTIIHSSRDIERMDLKPWEFN